VTLLVPQQAPSASPPEHSGLFAIDEDLDPQVARTVSAAFAARWNEIIPKACGEPRARIVGIALWQPIDDPEIVPGQRARPADQVPGGEQPWFVERADLELLAW
jgi:hypothetical protein